MLIPLRLECGCLLLDLLEGAHRVTVESARELHETKWLDTFTSPMIGCMNKLSGGYLVNSEGEPDSLEHELLFVGAALRGLELGGNPSEVLPC